MALPRDIYHTQYANEMEKSSQKSRPATLPRVLLGMFVAQVLAKTGVTYLLPHDPKHPDTLPAAAYHALWSTAHQDAILMPAAIAVLRYR